MFPDAQSLTMPDRAGDRRSCRRPIDHAAFRSAHEGLPQASAILEAHVPKAAKAIAAGREAHA